MLCGWHGPDCAHDVTPLLPWQSGGVLNDLYKFTASDNSFQIVASVNTGPGPRYGFGFAGSSDGNLYLLGGFAPSKNDTGSWVQLRGGFSQLEASTRVRDLANDDLWLFNSTSVGWTLLTDSVYSALCGKNADPRATPYFCKNYAGLSRLALVHHDSEADAQGSRLYIMGGNWYLPENSSAWASYDVANRSWSLLLSDTPAQTL